MAFIGREEQTQAIEEVLSHPGYQGIVLYGRRRLGKTELLWHVLSERSQKLLFFTGLVDNEANNTLSLSKLISKAFSLGNLSFPSFVDALEFVFRQAEKEEIYLVLDEYSSLRRAVSGIDSQLQRLIDTYKRESNLKLVLCGSSIRQMEDIQSENNPLYRRFQLSLLLPELDYYEASLFFPERMEEEKVALYAAFGGVPYYLEQIQKGKSVEENIILLLSSPLSHLAEETENHLHTELSKISNANAAFDAIAKGAYHFSDILSLSHISDSAILSDILRTLQKMDLVESIAPINEPNNKKKSGYRIKDPTMRFYYRYLYPHTMERQVLGKQAFYDFFIKEDFRTRLVPEVFEEICRQYLIKENKKGRLNPPLLRIGTYWYDDKKAKKNGQFDVAALTSNGYVVYEVKYLSRPLSDADIAKEEKEASESPLSLSYAGFFSKSGYDLKNEYPYRFYTLKDLYEKD